MFDTIINFFLAYLDIRSLISLSKNGEYIGATLIFVSKELSSTLEDF